MELILLIFYFLSIFIVSVRVLRCAWSTRRSEEGIRFLGTGVTDGCEPLCVCAQGKDSKFLWNEEPEAWPLQDTTPSALKEEKGFPTATAAQARANPGCQPDLAPRLQPFPPAPRSLE